MAVISVQQVPKDTHLICFTICPLQVIGQPLGHKMTSH